jgi:hypothetical protein
LRQARSGKRWGPPVCSAVLFFRHWLGSARDAARHCRSRHLLRLAARPKTARTPRGRRGHRVRGLWCFERLIRVGHRDRLAERRIPKLRARPPRHVVTRKTAARHSPAPALPMGSAAPGLISELGNARRAGQHLAVLPGCRSASGRAAPSVRGFVGSCARLFGPSGRPVLRQQGHAGPRSHLQARQRRPRRGPRGGLRSASTQFAAEAVLTAYTLMACGRGRGRRLQRYHLRQVEAVRAAGRRPRHRRPPGGGSRNRRFRVRRSGRGSQDPRLAAPPLPLDGP